MGKNKDDKSKSKKSEKSKKGGDKKGGDKKGGDKNRGDKKGKGGKGDKGKEKKGKEVEEAPAEDASKPQGPKRLNLEILAEMALLQEAKEGKTPEGFAGKRYREEKASFVRNIVEGARPIRILLQATARYPLKIKPNEDGTYSYAPVLKSPQGVYFIVFTVWVFYVMFMGTWNLTALILDLLPVKQEAECKGSRLNELIIYDRNIVPFAILWTALCHLAVANVNFYFKRDYFAKYLSFWTVAVHSMHVDVARGLQKPTIAAAIGLWSAVLLLSLMAIFRLSPFLVGAPALFSILQLRLFQVNLRKSCLPHTHDDGGGSSTNRIIFDVFAWLAILYIFIASKAVIFLFWYVCKMLKRAFVSWNGRFQAAILRTGGFVQSVQGRTTFQLLYKDHSILLDLLEGTDKFFGSTVEAYISLQIVSVIFEVYFSLRTGLLTLGINYYIGNDFSVVRYRDFIPGLIIVGVNVVVLFFVLLAAAEVGDEATAGLEVIRRRTMLGKRSDEELFFTVSMFSSYTCYKLVRLRGGGFFYFDKELLVTVISEFLSYFIVTYQFQPLMDYDYFNNSYAYDAFADKINNVDDQSAREAYIRNFINKFEAPPRYVQNAINGINQFFAGPSPPAG